MDTIAILERLVGFPTVPTASNLDLLDWVEAHLAPLAPRLRRFPSPDGTKANLLVSLGPEVPGGLLLSGHTDVVSTDNQPWMGDPFRLRAEGHRLVGRGATDMKGFIAACIATLPEVVGRRLARPIHLALSYDEEVGCTGVVSMTDWLKASGLAPCLAVIGEPSGLRVVNAHKGGLVGHVEVTGVPGHSSQPDRGVNAVMIAASAVASFQEAGDAMRSGPCDAAFDPPWSTVQVNTIAGGEARNILAARCTFSWEARLLPGIDPDTFLADLVAAVRARTAPRLAGFSRAGIAVEVDMRVPALRPEAESVERPLLALLGQPHCLAVPYGSEAGLFQEAGMPAVIIGPGNIAQAHQPDEWIDRAQLKRCAALVGRLVEQYCL